MQATVNYHDRQSKWIIWTILASIALHVTLAFVIPNFKVEPKKAIPEPIKVELLKPKPVAPQPVVEPEPPKVEPPPPPPPKPKPKPTPKKKIRPLPKPVVKPEPQPIVEEIPEPTPVVEPPPVIATTPVENVTPEVVVPPQPEPIPEPPPVVVPKGPTQDEINAAKSAYSSSVQREIKRNQKYPKRAAKRGIEGKVLLRITVDNEGNIIDVTVKESSGSSLLDKAAIAAVKASNIKQYMKAILKGHVDTLTYPVVFGLE